MDPQTRKEFVQQCLAKRMTYAAIAKLMGITRQRVKQIERWEPVPFINSSVLQNQKREQLDALPPSPFKAGQRDKIREWVRVRDKHTCQICLKVWKPGQRRFDVHHEEEHMEGQSKEKGITRYDLANMDKMVTLCHKCHLNLDVVRRKMLKSAA